MVKQSIVALLLFSGVGIELLCCIGVLAMDNMYDKLHFTAPATALGPVFIAAAIIVEESLSQAGVKALLIAGAMLISNPILSHVTARAGRIREHGHFVVRDEGVSGN